MNQDFNIINIDYLDKDIIQYILDFTYIYCHTCKKKYNIDFYIKLDRFYYCSKECYEHI